MSKEGAPVSTAIASSAAGDQPSATWFVLHTRSRQEKALAADLRAMGAECYLPLVQSVRYYGRRKAQVELPLFPGYTFLRGTLDEAYAADRTRRVAQIITVADQARFERELQSIQLALAQNAALEPHPYLAKGTWVEVRCGPLKGVQGLITDRAQAGRLVLQIQTLGQGASLEIDTALLEPLEAAPVASA